MEGGLFSFRHYACSIPPEWNTAIGNFDARGLIAFIPGYQFSQLENNELEWEKSETIDFGLDFEFLNNRVRGSLAYYTRYTRDLLLNTPLPYSIGFISPSIAQNVGEIRNQGFEFSLDVDVIKTPDVLWTIGVNGATLDNEVTKLVDNNNNGNQHSTRYLSDADFLRLRNLQIGYTFKNIGKNRNSIRIFAAGQNLLLWTKFDGLDPEASGQTATGFRQGDLFFSRPKTRSYTFGINLFL